MQKRSNLKFLLKLLLAIVIVYLIALFPTLFIPVMQSIRKHKGHSDSQTEWHESENREYLSKKLQLLNPIIECQWEQKSLDGRIGPSNFTIRGFVSISPEQAESFQSSYSWTSADNPKLDYNFTLKEQYQNISSWYANAEFDTKVTTASWVGYYYFCPEKNIIYFNIGN